MRKMYDISTEMPRPLKINNLGLQVASQFCGADIMIDDFCPDDYCYIIDGRNELGFDTVTVLMNTTRHRELQDNMMQTCVYPKWINTLIEQIEVAHQYTVKPLQIATPRSLTLPIPNPSWDLFTGLYPITKVNGTIRPDWLVKLDKLKGKLVQEYFSGASDFSLDYINARYEQQKARYERAFGNNVESFIIIPSGRRSGKKAYSEAVRKMMEFRHKIEMIQPKKPSWYELMDVQRQKYINEISGIAETYRGASTAVFEQAQARYNDMWKPKVLWGVDHSAVSHHVKSMNEILKEQNNKAGHVYQEPYWDTLILDDPMMDDLLIRGTMKSPKKKEKRSMFRFWRTVKLQAEKVELIWNALRWFGLIAWDTFDNQYITNKEGMCTRTGTVPAITLGSLQGRISDNTQRLSKLAEQRLDERVSSLETFTDDGTEARDTVIDMLNHYFACDYFKGEKGYIEYDGETIHGLIAKTEMKSFRILEDCCGDGWVSTVWTSKANHKLRTQQINRMETDVVNYLKEKEEDK